MSKDEKPEEYGLIARGVGKLARIATTAFISEEAGDLAEAHGDSKLMGKIEGGVAGEVIKNPVERFATKQTQKLVDNVNNMTDEQLNRAIFYQQMNGGM
ncbi:hypothetical protein [Streptomyces sp. NPDC050504]|uniref:hypothetical protein n=1 Tax=Streptomyces sp. NPDC050504 TaxID=3365618 RepID=UPI0037A3726E